MVLFNPERGGYGGSYLSQGYLSGMCMYICVCMHVCMCVSACVCICLCMLIFQVGRDYLPWRSALRNNTERIGTVQWRQASKFLTSDSNFTLRIENLRDMRYQEEITIDDQCLPFGTVAGMLVVCERRLCYIPKFQVWLGRASVYFCQSDRWELREENCIKRIRIFWEKNVKKKRI